MLTIVDRGADMLHAAGQLGDDAAAALKTEARRRVAAGTFFGYIANASLTARKPSRDRPWGVRPEEDAGFLPRPDGNGEARW
jgi:hypothetical protein